MWYKIATFLLAFSALSWSVDAVRVMTDSGYHPTKFTLVVAFLVTSYTVAKWAIGAWNEK